jgi:hypothetical protein
MGERHGNRGRNEDYKSQTQLESGVKYDPPIADTKIAPRRPKYWFNGSADHVPLPSQLIPGLKAHIIGADR